MTQPLSTSLSLDLLQSIRVLQALSESDYPVCLPQSEEWKFQELRKRFSIRFSRDLENAKLLSGLKLDHSAPLVSIGAISRPLLFPKEMLTWCRLNWPSASRDVYVSFCGLVTNPRQKVLSGWMRRQGGRKSTIPTSRSPFAKMLSRCFGIKAKRTETTYQLPAGPFLLWSSTRGRVYPIKAWDEEYFQILLRSKFVLCPSGDYIWSYRFFESIMCGAIPIVESPCEVYKGFSFFTMDGKSYSWSADVAQSNYELCCSTITIPSSDLNRAISEAL